jgi:hypothetical protein
LAHALGHAHQRSGHIFHMPLPGRVIVRNENNIGALQVGAVLHHPLAGAAGIARRGDAHLCGGQYVLLALQDEDRLLPRDRLCHLGQVEGQEAMGAVEWQVPNPAALAIRAPLPEVLGVVADRLESQGALGVGVIVGGDDALGAGSVAVGLLLALRPGAPCPQRRDDRVLRAARAADEQQLAALLDDVE